MFIGLTSYACFTKTDVTYLGGVLSAMSFVVVLVLILGIGFYFPWMRLGIIVIVLLLTSFWIIYDTQLIVGGKHKRHQLDTDDYIIGALIIYIDIITLFLYLLELFGGK